LEADAEAGVVLCGAGPADASRIPAVGPVCVGAHEDNERVLLYGSGRTGRFGAADALGAAQAADPMAALRQVGVAAADGTVAVATGALCIDHSGHVMGDGFAVQANMMSSPDVWSAMASAFESSAGPLARRLLAALVAGGGRRR